MLHFETGDVKYKMNDKIKAKRNVKSDVFERT